MRFIEMRFIITFFEPIKLSCHMYVFHCGNRHLSFILVVFLRQAYCTVAIATSLNKPLLGIDQIILPFLYYFK